MTDIEKLIKLLEHAESFSLEAYAKSPNLSQCSLQIGYLRACILQAIDNVKDLRERLEQEPVTAQHRFRHPQKTMPDWSEWQECKVRNHPACEIDSQGYEVEYRNLYTAPPQREWQGLFFDAVYDAWHSAGMDLLGGDWNTFALALEAKLKEKNTYKISELIGE